MLIIIIILDLVKFTSMKTIYILWLRQLKRHYRSKSRVLGSIAQPMLFLLSLGFGFNSIFAKAGAGNYINFLTPGIIGMTLIFTSIFSGIEIIWDKQFGFLKEILVAPVSRLNIMIGRTLGGASVAVLQGVFIYLMAMLVGFRPVSWYALPTIIGVMFVINFVIIHGTRNDGRFPHERYARFSIGDEFFGHATVLLIRSFIPFGWFTQNTFPNSLSQSSFLWCRRPTTINYWNRALRIRN